MNAGDILNIGAHVTFDNSITRYKFQVHQPLASTTYDYNDEIRFQVQNQDQYSLPSESILLIEGKIKKTVAATTPAKKKDTEEPQDGSSQTAGDSSSSDITFVGNGIAFLFDECRYLLNGIEIDKTRNLGYTTLMKGLCSFTKDEADSYQDAGWYRFGEDLHSKKDELYFSASVPLKLLLGFAEDHKRIICSARQDLILVRARDDKNSLHSTTPADKSYVEIDKITWMLPVVDLSDEARISVLSVIKKDPPLSIGFRSWDMYENPTLPQATNINWTVTTTTQLEKPRFVIIAFQSGKRHNLAEENDEFDHINIKDLKLFLNSEFYPYSNMNLDFEKRNISFLYYLYSVFQKSYYNREINSPFVDRTDFIEKYPLFVFDTCHQNDRLKNSIPVDIRLEIQTSSPVPANTSCYCLIIHDRVVEYTPLSGIVRRL